MRSEETKSLIAEEEAKHFFKYGIHSVSVDDICYAILILKKTFYECFSNKSELIEQIAINFLHRIDIESDKIMKREGSIDKIIMLYSFLLK